MKRKSGGSGLAWRYGESVPWMQEGATTSRNRNGQPITSRASDYQGLRSLLEMQQELNSEQ